MHNTYINITFYVLYLYSVVILLITEKIIDMTRSNFIIKINDHPVTNCFEIPYPYLMLK